MTLETHLAVCVSALIAAGVGADVEFVAAAIRALDGLQGTTADGRTWKCEQGRVTWH